MAATHSSVSGPTTVSAEEVLHAGPPPRAEPGARERIRQSNIQHGYRIAVLDDDPTGSQTVHDAQVVTVFEPAEYAAGLETAGSTCFILTNSRSLPEGPAAELSRRVAQDLYRLGDTWGTAPEIVSRSDSTLRGHVLAEVAAIREAHREVTGRDVDGVLLIPAFFEAGRFTAGDVHWATVDGRPVPVGESEFAKDATFGYRSSNLRDFVAEVSGGAIAADQVRSISLDDIRVGGPDRVAQLLGETADGAFVVINATGYDDLEIVVLGLQVAKDAGKRFLYRTGPSFVRALAGLEPREPLTGQEISTETPTTAGRHGLVVVGSHVGLTSRQVEVARSRGGLAEIELDVPTLVDPATRDAHIAAAAAAVVEALQRSDALLYTSRDLILGHDPQDSLAISRSVSTAVIEVVRLALAGHPRWVIAKGGITSHDVAVHGLGIRRATVLGQLFPGLVSVLRPVEAAAGAVGVPYVVFAGNVGDEGTLAEVIARFSTGSGEPAAAPEPPAQSLASSTISNPGDH